MFIRFSFERSPDLGNVFFSEATDRDEISKDPQRRVRRGIRFVGAGFCCGPSMFNTQMGRNISKYVSKPSCILLCSK